VLPRFSATLVEPKQQKLLSKYELKVTDVFQGIEVLRQKMARRVLPVSLNEDFSAAQQSVMSAMERLRTDLQQLDPTLVDSGRKAEAKMRYQLERLAGKAARAELLRNSVIDSHAQNLTTHLFPHKNLPEREIAGVYYLAKYGLEVMHQLYEAARNECPDHQLLYLEQ
jgi:bacillithiol synthase